VVWTRRQAFDSAFVRFIKKKKKEADGLLDSFHFSARTKMSGPLLSVLFPKGKIKSIILYPMI